MRKIWSSAKTSCSLAFSETALARSVPNGFSMTIARPLDETRPLVAAGLPDKAALGGTLR